MCIDAMGYILISISWEYQEDGPKQFLQMECEDALQESVHLEE